MNPDSLTVAPTVEVMLDIETLGTTPGSAILEIAAATFHPIDGTIVREFETRISLLDSIAQGFSVDPDTAAWHLRRLSAIDPYGPSVWQALCRLRLWLDEAGPIPIWAWGMDFERAMLQAAYHRIHAPLPWKYHHGNDARTVWNLAFPGKHRPARDHNALADVRDQIRDLTQARNHLLIQ